MITFAFAAFSVSAFALSTFAFAPPLSRREGGAHDKTTWQRASVDSSD